MTCLLRWRAVACAFSLVACLAACGGAGDGDATSTEPAAASVPDNEVWTAILYAPKSPSGSPSWFRSPSGTTTYPCRDGGSAVATVTTASIDKDTVGDSVTTLYLDCKTGIMTTNGSFHKELTAVGRSTDVTSAEYDLSITQTLSERRAVDGSYVATLDERISARIVRQGHDIGEDSSVITRRYSTTLLSNGETISTGENYTERAIYDGTTVAVTRNGTIDDASGPLKLSTIEPFRMRLIDLKPIAGTALTQKATGSQVRVTARPDGDSVFVEFDRAGDGAFEASMTTTWGYVH